MAAKDNISLDQFQNLIEWHGGTAFPHPNGGIQVTLSQRLGERWSMENVHHMEKFDATHPIVQKVTEESKKAGIL